MPQVKQSLEKSRTFERSHSVEDRRIVTDWWGLKGYKKNKGGIIARRIWKILQGHEIWAVYDE